MPPPALFALLLAPLLAALLPAQVSLSLDTANKGGIHISPSTGNSLRKNWSHPQSFTKNAQLSIQRGSGTAQQILEAKVQAPVQWSYEAGKYGFAQVDLSAFVPKGSDVAAIGTIQDDKGKQGPLRSTMTVWTTKKVPVYLDVHASVSTLGSQTALRLEILDGTSSLWSWSLSGTKNEQGMKGLSLPAFLGTKTLELQLEGSADPKKDGKQDLGFDASLLVHALDASLGSQVIDTKPRCGKPYLSVSKKPQKGSIYPITIKGLSFGQPLAYIFSVNDQRSGPFKLPFPLDASGATGCKLAVDPMILIAGVGDKNGEITAPVELWFWAPGTFHVQVLAIDWKANKPGLVFTGKLTFKF